MTGPLISWRPSMRTLARTSLVFVLLLCTLAGAEAGPRIAGRITRLVAAKRLLTIECTDGKKYNALVRASARIERLGAPTQMGGFRIGDYAVVEVSGPLNDDPLDCVALFDVHTAGQAPRPTGSANTSIQGGFAIPGGSAAVMPFPYTNAVPGTLGEPHNQPPIIIGTDPGHGTAPSTFPSAPQGGTMTAAPSPAGNPWLGQAVSSPPATPPVTTVRTPPPTMAAPSMSQPTGLPPSPMQLFDDEGASTTAGAGRPGLDVVSMQGSVTQLMAPQRRFVMQTLVSGQPRVVQVMVPVQIGIVSSRSQQPLGFENLQVGDYVVISGVQMMPGAVEARRLYVNK